MHSTSTRAAAEGRTFATARPARGWRVVDIVVVAVLGVACGLIFWAWNGLGGAWFVAADALTPGLGGMATGVWFLGGIVGGLVIRKPGAALGVELIAAIVSALLGNVWGVTTIYSGIVQGLGAELVLAAFLYRRFSLPVAMLAGVGAGIGAIAYEFFTGNIARSLEFNLIYLATTAVSGALLAGALGWALVRSLAATGALSRFAAGRGATRDV